MRESWGANLALLPVLLAALIAAALWYAGERGIPLEVVRIALPAFLLEAVLYVLSGIPLVRERLSRLPCWKTATLLIALAPVSWLMLTIPGGRFELSGLAAILGLATTASLWYVVLGRSLVTDLGFLLVICIPVLLRWFDVLYPDPVQRLPAQTLGLLMWYRTLLLSVLAVRRMEGVNFGFLPRRSEWAIGFQNFVLFLIPAFVLGIAIGFLHPRAVGWDARMLILAVLTFFGTLWVLAVAEEFFFRGLIQQLMSRLLRSNLAGLALASLIFGAAHLGFGRFPNWQISLIATVHGVFCGRAYLQAGSIRAAMVTHALVVTTWKTFFTT